MGAGGGPRSRRAAAGEGLFSYAPGEAARLIQEASNAKVATQMRVGKGPKNGTPAPRATYPQGAQGVTGELVRDLLKCMYSQKSGDISSRKVLISKAF